MAIVGAFPFIILSLFAGFTVIYYLRIKHREKMELIKNGENIVYQDALEKMKLSNLGRAIILISLGLAIFLSAFLVQYLSFSPVATYTGIILLFTGLGSLIFYFLIRKK